MLKLTKTGIGLLTKQYRSVLKKCLLLNLGLFLIQIGNNEAWSLDADNYICQDSHSTYLCNLNRIVIAGASDWEWNNGINISHMATGETMIGLYVHGRNGDYYGGLHLYRNGSEATALTTSNFRLSNSGYATGIDFAANVTEGTTDASHLATTGAINQLLNYYYTFRDDKTAEDIEFTKELKASFPVILRSAEHDVRISARSAARIDTGLKSGDRHVASLLTMTNQGVNASKVIEFTEENDTLSLMEVSHA